MNKMVLVGVDLFAGVGGMSLGFSRAGINVVAAVEFDGVHARAYRENHPGTEVIEGDITGIETATMKDVVPRDGVDIVFGGPPCQGFSSMGKRNPSDPRNRLMFEFARIVRELGSRYFVAENVAGLLSKPNRSIVDSLIRRFERYGYEVCQPIQLLDAQNFGVPQRRRRAFIIGWKRGEQAAGYPVAHGPNDGAPPGELAHVPVWDAIGDLPQVRQNPELLESDVFTGPLGKPSDYAKRMRAPTDGRGSSRMMRRRQGDGLTGCAVTNHRPETVARFRTTKPGTYEDTSRFFRLEKNGVAPTLRAGTGPGRGSFMAPRPIHPVEPRCITVREGARLQSFPDWYQFDHTKWHGFRQVGNSVPPDLAAEVAKQIPGAGR